MENEIRNEVERQVSNVGESELALAITKVEDPHNAVMIAAWINDYRKQFERGRVMSTGASSYASREVWQDIARQSNDSCKRELLGSSALLQEADDLTRKAREAQQLADAKTAELNRLYSEFNTLPERITSAQRELDGANEASKNLTDDKLRQEYKDWFKTVINSANTVHPVLYATKAAALVTANIQRECYREKVAELEARLVEMRKKHSQLAKKLR
jgi:hypothetical protein